MSCPPPEKPTKPETHARWLAVGSLVGVGVAAVIALSGHPEFEPGAGNTLLVTGVIFTYVVGLIGKLGESKSGPVQGIEGVAAGATAIAAIAVIGGKATEALDGPWPYITLACLALLLVGCAVLTFKANKPKNRGANGR